eukprot:TRINITY_DN24588_c0_g1_i1.p1 TRINITY_DN24588_c0_g1~~TRINITY_DN24588_c0_g1_i1.p1  ORF type:complete len:883 (+),score=246.30 TRINITY_DN24588_c0_g1_i1:96-2744(+)
MAGKPPAPDPAEVTAAGPRTLRIAWCIPAVEPPITACTLKVRIQGSQRWQNYDHGSGMLVSKGGATVPAPTCEVTIGNAEDGLHYEAVIAAMNSAGWGDISECSKPVCIGPPRPRMKPPRPLPPRLTAVGPGKMKCFWDVPEACPPVEACQLQLTDVARHRTMLVDAANGKLVESGRTTFAVPRCEANINGVEDGYEYTVAVCCRSAEGFGEYSLQSDSAVIVDQNAQAAGGMQLVLHSGPTEGAAPVLRPLPPGQGKIKLTWVLPEDAKATMVKIRRVGDTNWYLCGGAAIAAPACETVAQGLEEGIEYEAMVGFLVMGRWCAESPVSSPACIGTKRLPGIPDAPKEPRLVVLDQSRMAVRWRMETAVPSVTGCVVRFRPLGDKVWQLVQPSTGRLVPDKLEDAEAVPAPATEVVVTELQAGVRYETAIALRNKLGTSQFTAGNDIACIGRPVPKLLQCQNCELMYDLQHASYTKSHDNFWCMVCRFKHMDPFNALVEPHGFLLCHIVARPLIAFSIDLPDLKAWRKDDESIFMRMARVDSESTAQVWPKKMIVEANGHEVFRVVEPEEGHVRRDVPMNISAALKAGMNSLKITIEDENPTAFAFSLVRSQARNAEQIAADIPVCSEEDARARVMSLLAPNWAAKEKAEAAAAQPAAEEEKKNGKEEEKAKEDKDDEMVIEDEDITCVISNKLRLRCPLSFERVQIPVRGEQCMHLQCFGLGAYLESNSKMRAMNNRWTCPVCSTVLKPGDLRIDAFVERVLASTPSDVEEVEIMQDGSFRNVEEEDEPNPPAPSPGHAAPATEVAEGEEIDDAPMVEAVTVSVGDDKRKEPAADLESELPAHKRQKRRQMKAQQAAAAAKAAAAAVIAADEAGPEAPAEA